MQALAVLELSGPNRPSARIRKRGSRDISRAAGVRKEWSVLVGRPNLNRWRRRRPALEDRDHVDVRLREDHAALGGGKPEHERPLTSGATEPLSLVQSGEEDAPHDHHD